jgi:tripartite-type tricarboxylate transporter receptor subunit TctC
MLVLSRRSGEQIVLPDLGIVITMVAVTGGRARVGIVAPAKTPRDIVMRLNREIVDILKLPDVAEKLNQQGALPVGDTPEQFASYIKDEIAKWGAVVRSANIKAD